MFASKTITMHLIRGVIAVGLITDVVLEPSSPPLLAIAAGVAALVAMRGCPLCWTIGLCETIASRKP